MGNLRKRERRVLSNPQLLWLHEKRRGTPIPRSYEGEGKVMEHMDIYDMSFDELVDYIGDGDPAEILG